MTDKKEAESVSPKQSLVEQAEVVTETKPAFRLPTGEVVLLDGLLIWMANILYEINKKL